MSKRRKKVFVIAWVVLLALLLVCIVIFSPGPEHDETLSATMRDAVLHNTNKVSLFGIVDVHPSVISAFAVTGSLLFIALLIRIFAIPRFKNVPGKFQLALESLYGFFSDLAKSNSPHRNGFLSVYIFGVGIYIFFGTLFELLGIQVISTTGTSIALSAPLSDINAAIATGVTSYLVILSGGIVGNGVKGVGLTLKEFSLPISMSFRLFGALLSGLLVTELVYFSLSLSFVLPVLVAVMFTLLHALIQTYVLTLLTALFYGEVSEPSPKKRKKPQKATA